MALSDYIAQMYAADTLPDFAKLGGRTVVCDGVNANIMLDGTEKNSRILGVYPQQTAPTAENAASGTALTNGSSYIYAVRRKLTLGAITLYSEYQLSDTLTANGKDGKVTFTDTYEFPPAASALWTVVHQIYRSKADALTLLYHVADLTDDNSESPYTDSTVDGDLDATDTINIASGVDDVHGWVPPCSYARVWRQGFIMGGSHRYDLGTVDGTAASSTVTVKSPGQVRQVDIGAYVTITDEPYKFTITDVDTANGTWTVSPALTANHSGDTYEMFHLFNTIYVLNTLGSVNHEAYSKTSAALAGDENSDNPMSGIGVQGETAYIFYRRHVATLIAGITSYALRTIPDAPGCVAHRTIADENSPGVFYYAGENGVWLLRGSSAVKISEAVDSIIEDNVEHGLDRFTHGVWDGIRGMYHLWLFENDAYADYGNLRIPQLLLSYDWKRQQWYVGEMLASAAALVEIYGKPEIVVGLPGGLAKLDDTAYYDGDDVLFHWSATDDDTAGVLTIDTANRYGSETWTDLYVGDVGLAGFPIHLAKYDSDGNLSSIQRRIIQSNTTSVITLWSDFETAPATGDELIIGSMRWHFEIDEANLLPAWDREKNSAANVEVLTDPAAASGTNKMTIKVEGKRTKDGKDTTKTFDTYDRELVVAKGPDLSTSARSTKVTVEGHTAKELNVYAINVGPGRTTKSR